MSAPETVMTCAFASNSVIYFRGTISSLSLFVCNHWRTFIQNAVFHKGICLNSELPCAVPAANCCTLVVRAQNLWQPPCYSLLSTSLTTSAEELRRVNSATSVLSSSATLLPWDDLTRSAGDASVRLPAVVMCACLLMTWREWCKRLKRWSMRDQVTTSHLQLMSRLKKKMWTNY